MAEKKKRKMVTRVINTLVKKGVVPPEYEDTARKELDKALRRQVRGFMRRMAVAGVPAA